MYKIWQIKDPHPQLQATLSNALRIHPVIAQLLVNRQITSPQDAKDFLRADLSCLHDPFLLKDMDKFMARIQKARDHNEVVLIFGDYDVDGITSSAILRKALVQKGLKVLNYIPHRMKEGYGLNCNLMDFAKQNQVKLLICVDCGITEFSEVDTFNAGGMDVMIIDHHEPLDDKLPQACAIINPKRKDCSYPSRSLAAVGLTYKVLQALLGRGSEEFLDIVSLGTIADVVELTGENRIFAKEGLKRIQKTKNPGLLALMDVAGIKGKKMSSHAVGFILGPRLNATGRLGSAEKSLELLLCEDRDQAYALARDLDQDNRQRQKTQSEVIEEAMRMIERDINFKEHKVIILSKEGWHKGVLGIVASRILEKYYRPTIVISLEGGVGTGSARSIDGFHMFEALKSCEEILETYGGHRHAAGLTISEQQIDIFRKTINDLAKQLLTPENLSPTMELDSEISFSQISMDLVKTVESLEPFGEGNPKPLFCSRFLKVKNPPVRLGKDTLKFWVTDGQIVLQAVGFGMGKYFDMVSSCPKIDLAYNLSVDDWGDDPKIQLTVKDIRES